MKIKNAIKAIVCIVVCFSSLLAFAGTHPTTLPQVQSQDRLRSYALSIATHGSRYVYCASMDWSWTNTLTFVKTNGAYGEQVLDRLFAVPFSYRIINPDDEVYSYSYLYDTNNTLLFFGYGSAVAKDMNPTNGIRTSVWMQNIPLLSEVSNAQVLVLDKDGQTVDTRQLQVNEHGQMVWESWMSGYSNALLSVTYTDGTVYTYNLALPVASTPDVIYGSDGYTIDGHYQIVSSSTKGATLKIVETWTLPSAFLDLSVKQFITIDVLGLIQDGGKPYFERPVSVEIVDELGTVTTEILDTTKPSLVHFQAGKYRLNKFNWTKFGQPGFLYTGGGKG